MSILWKKMLRALKGYHVWEKIISDMNLNTDNFFLIYPGEEHLAQYLKKYLYEYMYEKNVYRVKILVVNEQIKSELESFFCNNNNVSVAILSLEQVDMLMEAYSYRGIYFKHLCIVSLANLRGRNDQYLINHKGIDVEDLIAGGLLNINLNKRGECNEKQTDWSFRMRS